MSDKKLVGYRENAKFYFGYAKDCQIRYKAASGGVGTAFIKYLLSTPDYGTALTFSFNRERCMYEPKLVYTFEDINICGSIYQDVDLVKYISENIANIKKGIVVSCMPCQVKAIKAILKRNNIKAFVLSLACSGQTSIEGTWLFYKFLGLKKNSVASMQYRGNGWPSGIQITLHDGTKIYKDNYSYPWSLIFESKFFKPKRCFFCSTVYSEYADLSLADSWLPFYKDGDKIGTTLFSVNTENGYSCLEDVLNKNFIEAIETNYESFYTAQKSNIILKSKSKKMKDFYDFVLKFNSNRLVRFISFQNAFAMKVHNYVMRKMKRRFVDDD